MASSMSTFRMDRELPTRPLQNVDHNRADPAELQVLLGGETFPRRGVKTSGDPAIPTCKATPRESPLTGDKQYSTLEGASFERGLDALLLKRKTKPAEYSGDVSAMIRRLQNEVDTLRFYMDERRKDHDTCIYEKIESKNSDNSDCNKKKQALRTSFVYHASNRGLYRLKNLLDPDSTTCRRLLWFFLFVCCSALLAYQIRDRVLLFMNDESDTKIEITQNSRLDFPSVTICNLNTYRLTALASLGLYSHIHRLVHGDMITNAPQLSRELALKNLTYADLLLTASHKPENLVHGCRWQKHVCGAANFTRIITDRGVCYTFTPTGRARDVTSPGAASGLTLLLNVEQYEYLLGPRSAVGVGVAIHERGDVPRMGIDGVYAATGVHTSMGVHRLEVDWTSDQHGSCVRRWPSHPPTTIKRGECTNDCEISRIIERCGCLLPYKTSAFKDKARPCTLFEYFFCVKPYTAKTGKHNCSCQSACNAVKFELDLSQSAMSSYAAESEARLLRDRGTLEEHFRHARDTYHRLDPDIFSYDIKVLVDISTGFRAIIMNLKTFRDSIPTQKTNLGVKYTQLVRALKEVNKTIMDSSDNFVKNHHLAFISFANNLKKLLFGILSRKAAAINLFRYNPTALNQELNNFTEILKTLVATEPGASNIILENLMNGIRLLRQDVVYGYGQSYVEFRESRALYNNTVSNIYQYIRIVNKTLRTNYRKLRHLIDSPQSKASRTAVLSEFFASISSLVQQTVNKMIASLDVLFSIYVGHTGSIKKLVNDLQKVGKHFSTATSVVEVSLARLRQSIDKLQEQIASIGETMAMFNEGYRSNKHLKTDIGEQFERGGMETAIERAQALFEQIERDVKSVCRSGRDLSAAIEPLVPRIVDMTDLSYSQLQTTLEALHYDSLAEDITALSDSFDGNLTSLVTLQSEVKEYLDANRIDGAFYQNNFLQLDIFYQDLSIRRISRRRAYGLIDLACDVGGSLALYLGAGILTIFEFLDFLCKAIRLAATSPRKM